MEEERSTTIPMTEDGVKKPNRKVVTIAEMFDDINNNNGVSGGPVIELADVSILDRHRSTLWPRVQFKSLSMSFMSGRIFAFIGSRKCGKSALLSTIAGVLPPVKGQVRHSGNSVGLMPQRNGFFAELTTVENLDYVSRLYGVEKLVVHHKLHRLMDMIGWEKKSLRASSLEPSQQTLLTLTIASLHSPSIMILDEPNFGSDLFLKEHIWRQLKILTRHEGVTIIFTTSIVEDVRFADEAAMIRNQSLIPCALEECQKQADSISTSGGTGQFDIQNLLTVDVNKIRQFVAQTYRNLEHIDEEFGRSQVNQGFVKDEVTIGQLDQPHGQRSRKLGKAKPWPIRLWLVIGLLLKLYSKKPTFLLSQLIVPIVMIVTFNHFVGHNPYNIAVAVYNPDIPPLASKHVLSNIDRHTIRLVHFQSLPEAITAVKQHQAWAAIEFPSNYTNSIINYALQNCDSNDEFDDEPDAESIPAHLVNGSYSKSEKITRIAEELEEQPESLIDDRKKRNQIETEDVVHRDLDSNDLSNDVEVNRRKSKPVNMITLKVYVDNTNLLISGFVKGKIFQALQLAEKEANENQLSPKIPPPLEIVSPNVYGEEETSMSEFLLPGTLVTILFVCVSVIPLSMIREIQERQIFSTLSIVRIDRIMLILGFTLLEMILLAIQLSISLAVLVIMALIQIRGPLSLAYGLLYAQGLLAILGTVIIQFLVGGNGLRALFFQQAYFTILLIFGGVFWPLDCLPEVIHKIAYCFPQPVAAETLRYIFSRGWSYQDYLNEQNPIIQMGINVSLAWIVALTLLMFLIVKYKHF